MDNEELRELAMGAAEELPASTLTWPFGPEHDVFKVCGKVFMLLHLRHGRLMVTVKADPREARALIDEYEQVIPGYHMNKRHWVTILPGDSLAADDICDIIASSYLLVVESLPRARRPVDPEAYTNALMSRRGR
ncbi:MmcQ/YjbR family DNA-binding protein [Actinomyces sp. B33]|uniref:MmcQ/YjbR family DNA-binding protein n=1 Tax=Actinomyces sp. B33 TaxID=2942131 RepID=UPI00233FEFBD|nr:MmcQ/YjbR family DNA-binding protein [Actinomyces sp. B33]MDC4233873.1 MmcQ/YjbR family DNA-binding protein [Actinomyces sp. B33]